MVTKDGFSLDGVYNPYRLQILASFLAYHKPEDVKFDMGRFSDETTEYDPDSTTCGTIGCAAGLATLIWPKNQGESFYDYSVRNFIEDGNDWDWCFHMSWAGIDNTPLGAAKRIQYLLDNGCPPRSYSALEPPRIEAKRNALIAHYKDIEIKNVPIPTNAPIPTL